MNKEELLQKELDLLREQFKHVGIKLNTLSYSRIAYAMKQYAIACCEEQKKACLTNLIELSDKVYQVVPDSDQNAILQTKNVAK